MVDKPLLVLVDHSDDPERQEALMDWAEEMGDVPPWDQYNLLVTDDEMSVAETPALDDLADAVADRVVSRLADSDTTEDA